MWIRKLALTALVVVSLAGCSSTVGVPTPAAKATTPVASDTPAASPSAAPAAGGGATDFCSAYQEFKTAVEANTPQELGAGFRAAATDMRNFAPAEIKAAAGIMADRLDQLGQDIASGKPNPGSIGSGQPEAVRQGIADAITWQTNNCHS